MNADTKPDATERKANLADAGLTKFDGETLKGIAGTDLVDATRSVFLPSSMAEAMELSKLMSASNFVPPHLRGKPGDCLAVVMQASRHGMDPFVFGNKTYFVNDRMALEAQLVDAILNTSKVLDGRLKLTFSGKGPTMSCNVKGKFKGDDHIYEIDQDLDTITTKNSPLWKQSPNQQLGYYSKRAWARLHAPEVLLGVYTPDELPPPAPLVEQPDGTYAAGPAPAKPTRASVKADHAAAQRLAQEQRDADARAAGRIPDGDGEPAHDAETGEIIEGEAVETKPEPEAQAKDNSAAYRTLGEELVAAFKSAGMLSTLKALITKRGDDLDLLRTEAPEIYAEVMTAVDEKKRGFAK